MDRNITVRHLEHPSDAEIKRLVDVLVAAFGLHDPFTDFLVGGDRSLVPIQFESNIRAASVGGEIHIASTGPNIDDIVGVALWYGPGSAAMATEAQREVGGEFYAKCPEALKKWWIEHLVPTMGRLADESLGPGFKEAQWALLLFGVVPEHQRKGVARAMMRVAEEKARMDGVSIVLETTTQLDLLIYRRMGFEVKGQATVTCPLGQASVYQMIKTL